MRLVSIALCLAAVIAVRPTPAAACKIVNRPMAFLVASDHGAAGLQPWISTFRLGGTPILTAVAAPCPRDTVCKGQRIATERAASYLRPAAPLAPGQRYQLTVKQQVLLDFTTIALDVTPTLAAWDGLTITGAAVERATTTCGFKGLVITATVKNWSTRGADLAHHVVLLYARKPDPRAPARGLGRIVTLGDADLELVSNSVGGNWLVKQPTAVWAILADQHGNLGAPIKLPMP